jgi:hypothetical protein
VAGRDEHVMRRVRSVVTTCSTTDGTGPGPVSGSDERMPSRNDISPWHQPLSVGGGCSRSLPGARATTSPRTGSCPVSGPAGVVRWTSREPARTAVTPSCSRSNPAATTRGRLGGLARTGRRHAWPSTVSVSGLRNRDVVVPVAAVSGCLASRRSWAQGRPVVERLGEQPAQHDHQVQQEQPQPGSDHPADHGGPTEGRAQVERQGEGRRGGTGSG